MPVSLIPSFLSFCFINGITPGPANLCSLSTAMNEGKQAALRQWRGLFTGFAIISLGSVLINAFLGSVLGEHVRYLAWAGASYLLWMAWNMIRPVIFPDAADEHGQGRSVGKASFWTGLLVQLTNVKIIVFCMTALSSFVLHIQRIFCHCSQLGLFSPLRDRSAILPGCLPALNCRNCFSDTKQFSAC